MILFLAGLGIFLFIILSKPVIGPLQPLASRYWDSFPGVKQPKCEADHHLHLVPRLRVYGALHPQLLYTFMVWCLGTGITLPLPLTVSVIPSTEA